MSFKLNPSIKIGFLALSSILIQSSVALAINNNKADSLKLLLSQTKNLEEKVRLHLELVEYFWRLDKDSTLYHYDLAEKFALKASDKEKAIDIAINKSVLLTEYGKYDNALQVLLEAQERSDEQTNPLLMARLLSGIGSCYSYKGNQATAVAYYNQAIDHIDDTESTNELAILYGRLGNVYYMNDSFEEAIIYYKRAGNLFKELNFSRGKAVSTMNIGNCFKQLNVADSAITYYTDAYIQFRMQGDLHHNEAQCLANIGNLNLDLKRYSDAKRYLISADSLFVITKNQFSIALVSRDLARLYLITNNLSPAKTQIDRCLEIAHHNNYLYILMFGYEMLSEYYDKTNDYQKAFHWHSKYSTIKDSIFYMEKEENIDMLLTQFETEQKVKEIEILKQADLINQLEIRRKTFVQYLMLLGLLIAGLFVTLLYFNVQRRKKTNQLLISQNAEINQQKEEITAQRDEMESQRDMVQSQKDILEAFRDHTTNSLRYAQSIQAAILPSEKVLEQISQNHFVFMKPCELVSGDFYWATTFNEYQVFCVADCTGHGVPGAFMSILGITALNDVVNRHRITKPAEILGHLRESVIQALSQNDPDQLHKDGMDITLCVFNFKTRELQFAGAGLPLWIVTEGKQSLKFNCSTDPITLNEFSLFEVKGDIMPVGQSPRIKPFTNHSINLKDTPALLYLVTDGFTDQFDEESRVKYGAKNLKRFILSNCNLPMKSQKEKLEEEFNLWKGVSYQIDDTTILGIDV